MDYYKSIELDEYDFKYEITSIFKVDLERDLFDIKEDVFNILRNREILELEEEKDITLNKLKIDETICFYISKKENDEECFFRIFDNYDEAKSEYDLYIKTKTMKDWNQSTIDSFEQFCKPGDIVGEDIVNEFLNSVPPVTHYEKFIQAGEPYSHELDIQDNKIKATYVTFEKEAAHWIYKGNCFKDRNIEPLYSKDKFEIVPNLEDFNENRLLLRNNETVASLEKGGYLISLEVNGKVKIKNEKGRDIPLYDKELKEAIKDGTFEDKYSIVHNNWLEISYYKKGENGQYDYLVSDSEVYYSIYELGDNVEEIQKCLQDWLDDYIEENEQGEVRE